jgi:hypothetical protein
MYVINRWRYHALVMLVLLAVWFAPVSAAGVRGGYPDREASRSDC